MKQSILGAILAVGLASVNVSSIYGLFATAFPVSGGVLGSADIEVYWEDQCVNKISSIDWGRVGRGAEKSVTVYVKNTGNVPLTLSEDTGNWSPPEAETYLALTWTYGGEPVQPNEVLPVTFTLSVSQSETEVTAFRFDTYVTGTETLLYQRIADCDSLANWRSIGRWDTSLRLNRRDYVEGAASIEERNPTGRTRGARYNPPETWDWSTYAFFKVWVKGQFKGTVTIQVYTNSQKWSRWSFTLSSAKTWQEIVVDLSSAPRAVGRRGPADLSSIDWFDMVYASPNGWIRWDDIRVEPLPLHTLTPEARM